MRHKYPSTLHMPFSPGITSEDKVAKNLEYFKGKEVVITTKMDGENSSLYTDGFHARSLDSPHHPSRDWLAAFHARFAFDIPAGWRICGENLYAQHSIVYTDLPTYFMAFSVWDDTNTCLSWDETLEMLELLGIQHVPVKYRGIFDEKVIHSLIKSLDTSKEEGLVMRLAGRIPYAEFSKSFAKWVRKGHVQTNKHWMHQAIVPNGLLSEK